MASNSQDVPPAHPEQTVNGQAVENDAVLVNGVSSEDQWPDPPLDREKFLEDLQRFHNQRG